MQQLRDEVISWLRSKRRVGHMLIGLGAIVLYEVARAYYRPFIYANAINDFHLADTLGNSLGTVATVFVFVSLFGRERTQEVFLIRVVVISLLLYEIAHPLLGKPIDPWDLVATALVGSGCEILYRLLHTPRRPALT